MIARLDGELVEVPVLFFLLAREHVGVVERPARRVRARDRLAVGITDGDAAPVGHVEPRVGAPRDFPPLGLVAHVAVVVVRRRLPPPWTGRVGDFRPRRIAQRRLPNFSYEYVEGGAEDEVTLRRNRDVFERIAWLPRALVGAGPADLGTEIFGQPVHLPLVIAPTGFNGMLWPQGDIALANAAVSAGIPFTLSTAANCSGLLTFFTPIEKALSGCFSTQG